MASVISRLYEFPTRDHGQSLYLLLCNFSQLNQTNIKLNKLANLLANYIFMDLHLCGDGKNNAQIQIAFKVHWSAVNDFMA